MGRTVADPCRRWSIFPKLIIQLVAVWWLMCGAGRPGGERLSVWTVSGLPPAAAAAAAKHAESEPDEEPPVNCWERIVTSGTFDDYYRLEDVGNVPSEQYPVNLSLAVVLGNRQEELGVLLSAENRSLAHPDYARTYEMRLTNVYTVLYRETIKLQAYHSPRDKLFPADMFRLRFLVSHDGNVTVLVNEQRAPRTLLAVYDKRPPLALRYISFSSRMNAYPVRYFLGCGMARYAVTGAPSAAAAAAGEENEEPRVGSLLSSSPAGPSCPVCLPQRCEVIVKACADPSPEPEPTPKHHPLTLNTTSGAGDGEAKAREKYYFFFTMHLTKNRHKSSGGGN
ncbi:uncharacterized protein LOC126579899 isoform X2 [Anopheles aquasalis]|uniref:uncharacterized protein LOC126579899 isoform X2 n=1 Tax=Anopheles aquasalis TaxID=42839 RepID=UPI00215B12B4|nr:uncharacterized protein LOC126579899 isoform X2 [Anopheles aquasalis]